MALPPACHVLPGFATGCPPQEAIRCTKDRRWELLMAAVPQHSCGPLAISPIGLQCMSLGSLFTPGFSVACFVTFPSRNNAVGRLLRLRTHHRARFVTFLFLGSCYITIKPKKAILVLRGCSTADYKSTTAVAPWRPCVTSAPMLNPCVLHAVD